MFYCDDCGKLFEDEHVIYDDPSPSGISLPPGQYAYPECPECGSSNYRDVVACCVDDCDEYVIDEDDCGLCPEHFKEFRSEWEFYMLKWTVKYGMDILDSIAGDL